MLWLVVALGFLASVSFLIHSVIGETVKQCSDANTLIHYWNFSNITPVNTCQGGYSSWGGLCFPENCINGCNNISRSCNGFTVPLTICLSNTTISVNGLSNQTCVYGCDNSSTPAVCGPSPLQTNIGWIALFGVIGVGALAIAARGRR